MNRQRATILLNGLRRRDFGPGSVAYTYPHWRSFIVSVSSWLLSISKEWPSSPQYCTKFTPTYWDKQLFSFRRHLGVRVPARHGQEDWGGKPNVIVSCSAQAPNGRGGTRASQRCFSSWGRRRNGYLEGNHIDCITCVDICPKSFDMTRHGFTNSPGFTTTISSRTTTIAPPHRSS